MLHMEETEKLLYRLTEWEQEQAAGRMTQREFRSALEALPRDLRPLDWYGIEAPAPGGREDTALPEFDEKSFILSGDDVCVRKHDTRDATPPHSHNFYELIAVLDGTARNAMENREVELGRGQLFLLCPKAVHGISCSPDAVVLNVLIRASFFRASFPAVFGVDGVQEGLFSPPGAPGRCMLFDMGEDEETRAGSAPGPRVSFLTPEPPRGGERGFGASVFLPAGSWGDGGEGVSEEIRSGDAGDSVVSERLLCGRYLGGRGGTAAFLHAAHCKDSAGDGTEKLQYASAGSESGCCPQAFGGNQFDGGGGRAGRRFLRGRVFYPCVSQGDRHDSGSVPGAIPAKPQDIGQFSSRYTSLEKK